MVRCSLVQSGQLKIEDYKLLCRDLIRNLGIIEFETEGDKAKAAAYIIFVCLMDRDWQTDDWRAFAKLNEMASSHSNRTIPMLQFRMRDHAQAAKPLAELRKSEPNYYRVTATLFQSMNCAMLGKTDLAQQYLAEAETDYNQLGADEELGVYQATWHRRLLAARLFKEARQTLGVVKE